MFFHDVPGFSIYPAGDLPFLALPDDGRATRNLGAWVVGAGPFRIALPNLGDFHDGGVIPTYASMTKDTKGKNGQGRAETLEIETLRKKN